MNAAQLWKLVLFIETLVMQFLRSRVQTYLIDSSQKNTPQTCVCAFVCVFMVAFFNVLINENNIKIV